MQAGCFHIEWKAVSVILDIGCGLLVEVNQDFSHVYGFWSVAVNRCPQAPLIRQTETSFFFLITVRRMRFTCGGPLC